MLPLNKEACFINLVVMDHMCETEFWWLGLLEDYEKLIICLSRSLSQTRTCSMFRSRVLGFLSVSKNTWWARAKMMDLGFFQSDAQWQSKRQWTQTGTYKVLPSHLEALPCFAGSTGTKVVQRLWYLLDDQKLLGTPIAGFQVDFQRPTPIFFPAFQLIWIQCIRLSSIRLDVALGGLVWWLDDHCGPFQLRPFCDMMIKYCCKITGK